MLSKLVKVTFLLTNNRSIHLNVTMKFLNNPYYEKTVTLFYTALPISVSVASSGIVTFPHEPIRGKGFICPCGDIRMHQIGLRQSHSQELNRMEIPFYNVSTNTLCKFLIFFLTIYLHGGKISWNHLSELDDHWKEGKHSFPNGKRALL